MAKRLLSDSAGGRWHMGVLSFTRMFLFPSISHTGAAVTFMIGSAIQGASEPGILALLGCGMVGLAALIRRHFQA
jgi:hypothetical protein